MSVSISYLKQLLLRFLNSILDLLSSLVSICWLVKYLNNLFDSKLNRVCWVAHVMNYHVQENLGVIELFLQFLDFLSVYFCDIIAIFMARRHRIFILYYHLCGMAVPPSIFIIINSSYSLCLHIRHLRAACIAARSQARIHSKNFASSHRPC